jgi:hypothetical protein
MNTQPKVLKWSVILGIVIVLNLFFNYAISLVYHEPVWNCEMTPVAAPIEKTPATPSIQDEAKFQACQTDWQTTRDTYNKNVFVVLVILGALSVLLGNFLGNAVVAQGLALGGVLSFIIASMRYWSSADDLIRLVILAIALGILVYVGYKKFNDRVRD